MNVKQLNKVDVRTKKKGKHKKRCTFQSESVIQVNE